MSAPPVATGSGESVLAIDRSVGPGGAVAPPDAPTKTVSSTAAERIATARTDRPICVGRTLLPTLLLRLLIRLLRFPWVAWVNYPRADLPTNRGVAIGDAGVDILGQVLPFGLGARPLRGLALECEFRLRDPPEAQLVRVHRREQLHVGHLLVGQLRRLALPLLAVVACHSLIAFCTSLTVIRPSA